MSYVLEPTNLGYGRYSLRRVEHVDLRGQVQFSGLPQGISPGSWTDYFTAEDCEALASAFTVAAMELRKQEAAVA